MTSVVFSGHMIDAPDRSVARFPADHEDLVATRIRMAVEDVADPDAEAFSGAACGGDLLFCEAWLASHRRLTVFLPRDTEAFIGESVAFAGADWVRRFEAVAADPATTMVGPEPGMNDLVDPHTPNNLRMLERACQGTSPLRGIFVWDGAGGDGPGGTGHMVETVQASGGEVTVIAP